MIESIDEHFAFLRPVRAHWQELKDEYLQVKDMAENWPEKELYNGGWDTIGVIFKGQDLLANQKLCPVATSLAKAIPEVYICGYSILRSGCIIHPHTGYTKSVFRSHLGLICPDNCSITVGDITRQWVDGEMFVFDDTITHSARNDSSTDRVILILDFLRS